MAKKKSQSSKGSPAALVVAVGLACAGGGYYAGKNGAVVEQSVAALAFPEKADASASQPAKSAPELKRVAEAPHAVKPTDKADLARLLKGADAKSAEAKTPEPKIAAAEVPRPPAKPELNEAPPPLGVALLAKDAPQGGEADGKITLSVGFGESRWQADPRLRGRSEIHRPAGQ